MWNMASRKQNNVLLHVVDIGDRKIKIPVAQLGNDGSVSLTTSAGKTILITAGMDGDEYSGIEAAYALIDYFSKQKLTDRIIIIPVVNIPGFEKAVSWNPYDNKYPKHIFPGKEKGSATERLMFWLSENFLRDTDLWIDLHSGAATEALDPFVRVWKSKNTVDQSIEKLLKKVKANTIIFDNQQRSFVSAIAKKKTAYILLESGELGQRKSKDVKQHIDWVKQMLSQNNSRQARTINVYENVSELVANNDGVWVPMFFGKNVKKGTVLGEVRTLDGKVLEKVLAKYTGVFLWRREAMSCKKGDDLYAYAYNKISKY